ncbi:GGDEF domain-containing protein [Shewanella algae]|uniref:diguanylate cyclase DgcS n=1 Tax=Shewanella algae TaxID=38313 RepID=UPI0027D7F41C|nr:GGDEF domain-containing protein [Shewanella algae]
MMDFGLATEFYPEDYQYLSDQPQAIHPRMDLLQAVQRLHASLDPRTVFACYGKLLQQYLPVQGVQLQVQGHQFHWGRTSQSTVSRELVSKLGTAKLLYRLQRVLSPVEQAELEQIEILLSQPLFNAIAYSQMSEQAMFDSLTELGNRHYFSQCIRTSLARAGRAHSPISLAVLDLDNFKQLNDSLGHKFGDRVLTQFGKLLKRGIRNADQAFRIGGDEFVVLVEGDLESAVRMSERLLEMLTKEPLFQRHGIASSIGIAVWSAGINQDQLFEQADRALYRAKATGRNRYCVATRD